MKSETISTAIKALEAARHHNDVWGYQRGSDIRQQIYNHIDAALADLQAEAEGVTWEPIAQSLEYDLITYAIRHGELPDGYAVMKRTTTPQPDKDLL